VVIFHPTPDIVPPIIGQKIVGGTTGQYKIEISGQTPDLKTKDIDELLPLFIILGHKYPHVEKFYTKLFKFCGDLAKAGGSSWVGSWMSHKLACMVMERFGLLWLGGAFSYDQGLSWAFGVISATEFLSDIQVGDIIQNIYGQKES